VKPDRLKHAISASGPFGFLLLVFLAGMAWLSASRLLLFLLHGERLLAADAVWKLFPIGLRMDSITLSVLLMPPALALLALPGRRLRSLVVAWLLTPLGAFVIYMELATPPFLGEYEVRPNRVFFEYLVYPREVFSTLVKHVLWVMVAGTGALLLFVYGFWRWQRRWYARFADWSWPRRLAALPLVLLLLVLGARSTLDGRAVNISLASFSNDHLANELALNSSYSLLYAVYNLRHEENAARVYDDGDMGREEMLERVRRYIVPSAPAFPDTQVPTLHHHDLPRRDRTPPNLVIFVQESLGARYVGSLGGLPLTPNLDRLSREGLYFTQLYATGTRTVRGLEALATGFPPLPAPSVLKLDLAQRDFFTLAGLLRGQGYATDFIYGGVGSFDNMAGFFLRNGFDRVIDQDDFENPAFVGTWGVSDEDLVAKANEVFRAHGDRPFFALMLSTTNHSPFEFPPGRIELYEQPAGTRHNAMKYADYAIGRLFELARQEAYYANTIFLIVADHDPRVQGPELVPIDRFRIPGLIIGPGVPKRRFEQLASQIDLAPTLLHLMGIETQHPMIGRDLLQLPPRNPGRAVMQYGLANAFRVGDKVVIHEPGGKVGTYLWTNSALRPAPRDIELERDALAHLLWASWAYSERAYRLPGDAASLARAASGAGTGSPAAASNRRTAIKGSPTRAVGSSLRIDSHRLMPSPSD
jgi:phosphoglycerol transferase MdoB-like AlkP superfamily enzyme